MRMLVRVAWVLTVLFWPWAARAFELGDPYFESVGDADSIPDNNVTALAQDHAGLLWIGTPSGLIRYDGYRFKRYARDPADPQSLGGGFIRALLVARDGRLWIGTDADGVSVLDPDSGRFTQYRHDAQRSDSLSHDQVRALAEDASGGIWLGTRVGLDRLDPATTRFVHHPQRHGEATTANDDRIFALLVDRQDTLWIGSWNGLSKRTAGSANFVRVHSDAAAGGPLAGQLIMSLYALSDGQIGVGTAQVGSYLIAPGGGIRAIPSNLTQTPSATEALALAMIEPTPGELWLAALGGIAVVDSQTGQLLRQLRSDPAIASSLAHTQVRTFLQDRAGQIWIGGYSGGLQRHDPRNQSVRVLHHSPTRADGLSSPSVSGLVELSNGQIWVGTRENGIDILDPTRGIVGGFRPNPGDPKALGNGMVLSLAQTRDGAVFAGTLAGMYRHDPISGDFSAIGMAHGLTGTTVRCLLASPDGHLWVGSNTGLSRWRADTGKVEVIDVDDAQPLAADVNALALTDDELWVGSAGGLYRLAANTNRLQRVESAPGAAVDLARASIVGLLIDRDGQLWLDTAEGLHRLLSFDGRYASFEAVSAQLGIGGRPFGANLLQDGRGRIWTQRYVYDPASNSVHELSRADGLDIGTAWFRSYLRTRAGLLLFGGSQGLAVVHPERFEPWLYAPPVVATERWVDGIAQGSGRSATGITLPAGYQSFGFEFAALDYTAPQRNRYAYQLVGFDRDWIQADSSRRIASYSNLWPGDYQLVVRGSNRNGVWAPSNLMIPIKVLPRLWQTWWFALLLLAVLLWLARWMYRRHLQRIRRHEHELELMVDERTAELTDAKERAETALQQLQGAQRQLVVAEKMASLGQLVAGVAHEINTPLGIALTAASVQSEELRKLERARAANQLRATDLDSFMAVAGQAGRLVDTHLARAAHLVRSFKQVSMDRSLDERRRFVLVDYLDDLVESLEIAWKRRPIRLRLNCDKDLVLDSYPGTLGQIITTFARNALLHAYDQGQAGTLMLSAHALDAERIELVFADDGKGIAAADLPHVFEPFFTTRRAEGCVGLGLHIVFNQVHARLHGQIDVSSAVGVGTRFTLVIPKVAP